ncbi:hypothetical protein D3C87_1816350 [compost metagenome]
MIRGLSSLIAKKAAAVITFIGQPIVPRQMWKKSATYSFSPRPDNSRNGRRRSTPWRKYCSRSRSSTLLWSYLRIRKRGRPPRPSISGICIIAFSIEGCPEIRTLQNRRSATYLTSDIATVLR